MLVVNINNWKFWYQRNRPAANKLNNRLSTDPLWRLLNGVNLHNGGFCKGLSQNDVWKTLQMCHILPCVTASRKKQDKVFVMFRIILVFYWREKLIKLKSFLWRMHFRLQRKVAAPNKLLEKWTDLALLVIGFVSWFCLQFLIRLVTCTRLTIFPSRSGCH